MKPTEPFLLQVASADAAVAALVLPCWQAMLDALPEAAWVVEPAGLSVCAANAAAQALLGPRAGGLDTPPAPLVGRSAEGLIATPEDLAFWDEARGGHASALDSETVLSATDGRLLQVLRRIRPLPLPGGAVHWLVTLHDRSAAEREAQQREELLAELQATLESTADGILVTDLSGRIRSFNRRFAQIWGLPEELLTQRQDEAVFDWMRRSVLDPEGYQRRLSVIQEATLLQATEQLELHSGQVLERVTRPQCTHGRPCGRVWAFRDRTELTQAGAQIEALASTDALTGLPNRRQLAEALQRAMQQAQLFDTPLALLLLDLDRFAQVNDSLGQAVGDRVLLDTAARLQNGLRQGDLVARVGADQFALLVHDADAASAEAAARRLLRAVAEPRAIEGHHFTLTGSIGVALFPRDADSPEQLLRHAETAMRRAKEGGRETFRVHQPHDDGQMRQRLRLDHAMRQALASQHFRLHYQPQIDLPTGRVIGAEALIRWRDPELGEVSPGQFIPVAEQTGFIIAIGDWVLAQATAQAAAWRDEGHPLPVSVNVSALQFQQLDFEQRVADVLAQHQLPGALLELELTESILVHDADDALARLSRLAQMGVRLAIDDFGTGYSSLAYLKRFPIERLKIDRSFVKGVPGDESDAAIVRAVVQLAKALEMKVIAEGVETEPQRRFLLDIGCDEFQGFLYAPALDPLAFAERLRGSGPRQPKRPKLTLVIR